MDPNLDVSASDSLRSRDVVAVFTTNQATVRVILPYKFEHVVGVTLREVFIVGGTIGLYRIKINQDQPQDEVDSNILGEGLVFACDSTTASHYIYDTVARIVSRAVKGTLLDLGVQMQFIAPGATQAITAPAYTQLMLRFEVIQREQIYTPDFNSIVDRQNPLNARLINSQRAPYRKPL